MFPVRSGISNIQRSVTADRDNCRSFELGSLADCWLALSINAAVSQSSKSVSRRRSIISGIIIDSGKSKNIAPPYPEFFVRESMVGPSCVLAIAETGNLLLPGRATALSSGASRVTRSHHEITFLKVVGHYRNRTNPPAPLLHDSKTLAPVFAIHCLRFLAAASIPLSPCERPAWWALFLKVLPHHRCL